MHLLASVLKIYILIELAAQRRTRCLPPGEGPPRVRTPPGEQVNKCYNIHSNTQTLKHTYGLTYM